MALSPKIAKVLDAACSTIRTGADGQTVFAATGTTATGALIFSNPVLLTCVGAAALGFAGWSIYRDLKSDNDIKQLQSALMEMIKQRGSLAAAAEDNFDSLELGQIDASIDLDQLKSGLQKLYKFSALNRRERHQQAAEHAGLIESLKTFADARFDEISSQLDEALSMLRPCPRFGIKEAPTSTDALASLRFTNRTVELVGRHKELNQLDAFLDNTPDRHSDFAFWLMTGPGGMGKSRLAHELCLRRYEQDWDTGFWEHSTTDVWLKWQPDAPTLIVFDYLFGRPEAIADAISALAGRRLAHPVRFLVLEREARGAWWERVSAYEAGKTRQDLSGYQHADSSLELSGLDEDAAKAFFRDAQPDASEDQIAEFAQVFGTTDPQGRPLYAQAIVEAARDFGIAETVKFTRAALVLFILKKERTRTANFIKDDATRNAMRNLLAISTLARGLSRDEHDLWEDPELSRLLPPENAFNIEEFRAIASSSSEHTIPGLEPDLVGEMFVLQQLATTSAANRKRIVHAAWHRQPEDTALMCDMAIRDFAESDWIDGSNDLDLQNKIATSEDLQAIIDSVQPPSYFREATRAYINGDFQVATTNYSRVIELPDAPVALVARALINRGITCGQLERWDDMIADCTRVIELPDAPVGLVAQALFNRGAIYSTLERADDVIADYKRIIVEFPEAPVDMVAQAFFIRGIAYSHLERANDAIANYTQVIKLPDAPVDQVAEALYSRGTTYLVEPGRMDDAIADYTQVIKLPDAPVDTVAKTLVNRSFAYNKLERMDDAIADCTQVIKLPGAPVDMVAHALVNRGDNCIGIGEFSLAIRDLAVALGMSEAGDQVRQEAIGSLKAVCRNEELDEVIRGMAEKGLRDAGIDPDE